MKLKKKNKKVLLQSALGLIKSDLAITNIELVNVITGEIYPATVFVHEGFVTHVEVEELTNGLDMVTEIVDGEGKYLIPGLIDAHVHIESSMLIPRNFAKASVPHGTTTVITDPHEIANVYGVEGVKYMHDSSANLPQRHLIDIPSCVPSVVGLEFAGAEFKPEQIAELANLERVIGLAEVMDFVGVIEGQDRMLDIIDIAEKKGLYIQGHAPGVTGRSLSAYTIGGPRTDHESVSASEAIAKLRAGMFVDARASSLAHNVVDIVKGLDNIRYYDQLCLCTDDRESEEILHDGQMNEVVKLAVEAGLHPIDAIRAASYNIAREIKADDLGAIAPGYIADMLLVDDLNDIQPSHVFFEGELVAKDNELVVDIVEEAFEIETRNSVTTKQLSVEDFIIDTKGHTDEVKVNVMYYTSLEGLETDMREEVLPIVDGKIDISFDKDLKFIAIVNRHHNPDMIGLGIIRDFGSDKGTLATTISHDSHNLTIVYDTPENALIAANELIRVHGGQTAVLDNEVVYTLELPVGGLMSTKDPHTLADEANKMKAANRKLGLLEHKNPLLRIVWMALIVIPKYKISELGMIDVLKQEIVDVVK